MRNIVLVLISAAVVTACTGCLGDEGLPGPGEPAPQSSTYKLSIGTALIPDGDSPADQSANADGDGAALSLNEQSLLAPLLSELLDNAAGEIPLDLLDGTRSWRDLKRLGLGRRDFAILALDLVAARDDLSEDQRLALQLARAVVGRDNDAIGRLLLERVLPPLPQQFPVSNDGAESNPG